MLKPSNYWEKHACIFLIKLISANFGRPKLIKKAGRPVKISNPVIN